MGFVLVFQQIVGLLDSESVDGGLSLLMGCLVQSVMYAPTHDVSSANGPANF